MTWWIHISHELHVCRHFIWTTWRIPFCDGYCSTVQGLLDWFEVDLGFTELLFIQIDLYVSVVISYELHDVFRLVTWLNYMCDMMPDMTHVYVRHNESIYHINYVTVVFFFHRFQQHGLVHPSHSPDYSQPLSPFLPPPLLPYLPPPYLSPSLPPSLLPLRKLSLSHTHKLLLSLVHMMPKRK